MSNFWGEMRQRAEKIEPLALALMSFVANGAPKAPSFGDKRAAWPDELLPWISDSCIAIGSPKPRNKGEVVKVLKTYESVLSVACLQVSITGGERSPYQVTVYIEDTSGRYCDPSSSESQISSSLFTCLRDRYEANPPASQDKLGGKLGETKRKKYEAYRKTPAWRAKRDLVLKRAKGICEGCGEQPATEVHHLTYAHLGNELLWELVAVCRSCHERAGDTPTSDSAVADLFGGGK